jgi:hypothetical protein
MTLRPFAFKRALVIGGASFLRGPVLNRAITRDDDVLCVDNFYAGPRTNVAYALCPGLKRKITYFEALTSDTPARAPA